MSSPCFESGRALNVGYAFDRRLQEQANASRRNYWYVYIEEILSRIGVCAKPVELDGCADAEQLGRLGVLFLGDFSPGDLPPGTKMALTRWVEQGGVLIGFATRGLDGVFGIAGEKMVLQGDGPFSINGYFEFLESEVTSDCRPPMAPQQRLIVLSPIHQVHLEEAEPLARLFLCDPDAADDGRRARPAESPAITHRRLGLGRAFYYAFDVAQTMWTIQQGRPITGDHDDDGYLRRSDASVIGENSPEVPYSDSLHFLLTNMIGRLPIPMIHQIPPVDGRVAPALLHFGGDDEGQPGLQVPASDFMASRGFPYHINLMPTEGGFAIDADEGAHIESNGHELALHYDFMTGFDHPCGFTRGDLLSQGRLFRKAFGRDSVCGVNHWFRWWGWAEPARWMQEAGNLGDNSWSGWVAEPLNPINEIGFAHGSGYPRFFWDDAEHGNARIDLVEVPITGYEVGYLGEDFIPEKVREGLGIAVSHHLISSFFYHPVYITNYPACREAIDELARLIGEMPVPPVLMGTDRVCHWWRARSDASISSVRWDGEQVCFEAQCDFEDGFAVKIPTGAQPAGTCTIDGDAGACERIFEFGQHWAFIPLGPGRHVVEVGAP